MLKAEKAKGEENLDSDLGIMGSVVPLRNTTEWHNDIEHDPLAVLFHIGYKHSSLTGNSDDEGEKKDTEQEEEEAMTPQRRNSVVATVRRASIAAMKKHEARLAKKKKKREKIYEEEHAIKLKKREEDKLVEEARNGKLDEKYEMLLKEGKSEEEANEILDQEEQVYIKTKQEKEDQEELMLKQQNEDKKAHQKKNQAVLLENLIPQGTTKFIEEKVKEWGASKAAMRSAVLDLGIRHVTEEQYDSMEVSGYYDFSTFASIMENHGEDDTITSHGLVYETALSKFCSNFRIGNQWQSRWWTVDSTKLRMWDDNQFSSKKVKGVPNTYYKPNRTYDLRCVETIHIVEEEEEEEDEEDKKEGKEAELEKIRKEKNYEFVITMNKGKGYNSETKTNFGNPNEEDHHTEWDIVRLRAPNRAIYETWFTEIAHRVYSIALISAILKARHILTEKEHELIRLKKIKEEMEANETEKARRLRARKLHQKQQEQQRLGRLQTAKGIHREPKSEIMRLSVLNGHGFSYFSNNNIDTRQDKVLIEVSLSPFDKLLGKYDVAIGEKKRRKSITDEYHEHYQITGSDQHKEEAKAVADDSLSFTVKGGTLDIPLVDSVEDAREICFCVVKEQQPQPEGKKVDDNEEEDTHVEIAYTCCGLGSLVQSLKDQVTTIQLPISHLLSHSEDENISDGLKTTRNGAHTYLMLQVEWSPVLLDKVECDGALVQEESFNKTGTKVVGQLVEIDENGVCTIETSHVEPVVDKEQLVLRSMFMKYDVEHQGHITQEQLKTMFDDVTQTETNEAQIQQLMAAFDEDHNGTVEQIEFVHWVQTGLSKTKKQREKLIAKGPLGQTMVMFVERMESAVLEGQSTMDKETEAKENKEKLVRRQYDIMQLHRTDQQYRVVQEEEVHAMTFDNIDVQEEKTKGEEKEEEKEEVTTRPVEQYTVVAMVGDVVQVLGATPMCGSVLHVDDGACTIHINGMDEMDDATNTYTITADDTIQIVSRTVCPKMDINTTLHKMLNEVKIRKKTTWEKNIDTSSRALVVHMGWADYTAEHSSLNKNGGKPIIAKRVLPLHTDDHDDDEHGKSVENIKGFIHNGENLRNALDSMSLHSVEDQQFHDLVQNDDYFDTSARASIQKRSAQRRPSNFDVLGPRHEGYLLKEASSNRIGRNNWQKRYFVLDSQYLRYWTTSVKANAPEKTNKKGVVVPNVPAASIDLRSIKVNSIEMIEGNTLTFHLLDLNKDETRKTLIEHRPPYVLQASTNDEADRWLKELQYRVRNIRLTRVMSTVWSTLNEKNHLNKNYCLSRFSSVPTMGMDIKKLQFVRAKPNMQAVQHAHKTPRELKCQKTKFRKSSVIGVGIHGGNTSKNQPKRKKRSPGKRLIIMDSFIEEEDETNIAVGNAKRRSTLRRASSTPAMDKNFD